MTSPEIRITDKHKKQLRSIGILMAVGTIVILAGWAAASRIFDLTLITTCRLAGVSALALLAACFLMPLLLKQERAQKVKGFIIFWFIGTLMFDLLWQVPLWSIPAIHEAAHTPENLPWAIVWWSYTLTDRLYTEVTPTMVAFEIWWLLGNLFGLAGLVTMKKGHDAHAYALLGVCGAFQCYNATIYLFSGIYVDRLTTVAPDVLGTIIYWGFNGFWAAASASAGILSFRLLLAPVRSEGGDTSGRRGDSYAASGPKHNEITEGCR